jgi:hypothetical protein
VSSRPLLKSLLFLSVGVMAALGYGVLARRTPRVCATTTRPARKVIPATLALAQPTSSTYDPVATFIEALVPAHQIFERETVDPSWATPMRRQVFALAERALIPFPGSRVDELECRLSSCRVLFSSRLEDANEAALSLQRPMVASVFSLGLSENVGGRFSQEAFLLFRPALRDIEAHRRWYEGNVARVSGKPTSYVQR